MLQIRNLICLCVFASLLNGCGTFRKTSTTRTALEQALLSQSVESALNSMQVERMEGKSFSIDPQWVQAVDEEYIFTAVNQRLLESGMKASEDSAKSDVVVYPSVAYSGTDDSSFLLGIPAIAIPLPFSSAPLTTPELALFKLDRQYGRTSLGLYGVERSSGELAFSVPMKAGEAYYKLWTILFLINFDTTNLPEPYN